MTPITDPYKIELTPHEVEELINFELNSIVPGGHTIAHSTAQSLCNKGLACRMEGGYTLTMAGQKWVNVLRIRQRSSL